MAFAIRRGTEADVPRLLEVERRSFRRRPYGVKGFREVFKYSQSLIVGVEGRAIVGFATWTWSPHVGPRGSMVRLHLIAVDPDARGKGYGSKMLARCITNAKRARDFIELTSRVSNTEAHALFAKHAFVPEPAPRGNYPDGEPALHWKLSFTRS